MNRSTPTMLLGLALSACVAYAPSPPARPHEPLDAEPPPGPELACDGIDNDGDDALDEGPLAERGACDLRCDRRDDDDDGRADEGCSQVVCGALDRAAAFAVDPNEIHRHTRPPCNTCEGVIVPAGWVCIPRTDSYMPIGSRSASPDQPQEERECTYPRSDLGVTACDVGDVSDGDLPRVSCCDEYGEVGRALDEARWRARITHPFLMKRTEVTRAEWQRIAMASDPDAEAMSAPGGDGCIAGEGMGDGESCPVERVSWYEAAWYANAASRAEDPPLTPCYDPDALARCLDVVGGGCDGDECVANPPGCDEAARAQLSRIPSDCDGYRLPTEAEWEYAIRLHKYGDGIDWPYATTASECYLCHLRREMKDLAHFAAGAPTPVGSKMASFMGLYDMYGNIAEWVHDHYGCYCPDPRLQGQTGFEGVGAAPIINWAGPEFGNHRGVRGGAFDDPVDDLRTARRASADPLQRSHRIGFRLVRSIPDSRPLAPAQTFSHTCPDRQGVMWMPGDCP